MNRWFGDKERGIATALSSMALPAGQALSFTFIGLWFHNEENDFKESFKNLVMLQAIVTVALWCLFCLVMKEKPEDSPSSVAEVPYEYLDL